MRKFISMERLPNKLYIDYLVMAAPERLFSLLFEQWWYTQPQEQWVNRLINNQQTLSSLEIGCGPFGASRYINKQHIRISACDKNQGMLNACYSNNDHINYFQMDLSDKDSVTSHNDNYDLIFGASILNVVKNPNELLANCSYLLASGGHISFLFPTPRMNQDNVASFADKNNITGFSRSLLSAWSEKSKKISFEMIEKSLPKNVSITSHEYYMDDMVASLDLIAPTHH